MPFSNSYFHGMVQYICINRLEYDTMMCLELSCHSVFHAVLAVTEVGHLNSDVKHLTTWLMAFGCYLWDGIYDRSHFTDTDVFRPSLSSVPAVST